MDRIHSFSRTVAGVNVLYLPIFIYYRCDNDIYASPGLLYTFYMHHYVCKDVEVAKVGI